MSKKILPIVALLGASSLVVGISIKPSEEEKKDAYINHIQAFEKDFANYISASADLTTTALNKYNVALLAENFTEDSVDNLELNKNLPLNNEENLTVEINNNPTPEITDNEITENNDLEMDEEIENEINIDKEISTLYSLSDDIEQSCDEFCQLKESIAEAIVETQNLIKKVQNQEIELTSQQRMFITEQAQQLKNLGRQLSNITTELSFNLSDLNQIMHINNQDIDNLSLKYLIVLDNLVNGNEMLQSGLSSLNMINQMFNMRTSTIPSNNQGRILYGFQQNNNPPVIKDYYIDEQGNMVENNQTTEEQNNSENNNIEASEKSKSNIDTYKNTNLQTNLDTYNNTNLNRNIDTFFNTALFNNEFMYGNNYGYGMYGANPYMNNYANYERNSTNGVQENQNTQNIFEQKNNKNSQNQSKKEKKRFKLKKNIDTFKDENEPNVGTKLANIKNSITGFFSKFKKSDLSDKAENPVYRFKTTDNTEIES